jgi:DNA-directed RNA polymerase alpha subunit
MKFVFRNVSDETLIAPAVITIFDESEKRITTTDLINKLRTRFILPENEKKILTGRKDDVFSQKVRNIKSHKTLEKMNLVYEANNYIWLTEHGKNLGSYLKDNLKNFSEVKEDNIDNLKHYKNLIFKSTYNLKFNPFYLNKITDFDLSARCTNVLKKLKIIYIGDLVQLSEENILKEKNSGIKTLNEIKYFLKDHDIKFESKIEDWNEQNIKKYTNLFFIKKKAYYLFLH